MSMLASSPAFVDEGIQPLTGRGVSIMSREILLQSREMYHDQLLYQLSPCGVVNMPGTIRREADTQESMRKGNSQVSIVLESLDGGTRVRKKRPTRYGQCTNDEHILGRAWPCSISPVLRRLQYALIWGGHKSMGCIPSRCFFCNRIAGTVTFSPHPSSDQK